ncbi:MAG: nucleotidyl transferase AbiEii/AbiGii toxin family protein [Candidatus Omnitrophica bacterium]|nr:nucleotidyl transferase AbiEii/AbiGii toxin family protein [Candidatus Omnitrophota bacterium]
MKDNLFYKQADLLIQVLPHIAADEDLALHGGTAINFFVRDMPRLSVDIDLTYLPILPREESLKQVGKKLQIISKKIRDSLPAVRIDKKSDERQDSVTKLFVNYKNAIIKIEPNQVIRGAFFACEELRLCKKAEQIFERSVAVKTLSFAELYGSKICAALDRQHPRDLFDIMLLLKNEGVTDEVRKAFLVYLISHNRPMSELLEPKLKDVRAVFENEFSGMTSVAVSYADLENARRSLIQQIKEDITKSEREFLLSFKEINPKWDLLGVKNVEDLPAVKWKLSNLRKMDSKKHTAAIKKLDNVLFG